MAKLVDAPVIFTARNNAKAVPIIKNDMETGAIWRGGSSPSLSVTCGK